MEPEAAISPAAAEAEEGHELVLALDAEEQPGEEFEHGAVGEGPTATQADIWAGVADIVATQCGSKDAGAAGDEQQGEEEENEPEPVQPAKLGTAAKLQRSNPQVVQLGKRGQQAAAAVAGSSRPKGAGRSPAGKVAGVPAQLAFKTPHPRTEPEPWAKKGAVTATTGAAAAAG
jgi:hypothetical protein